MLHYKVRQYRDRRKEGNLVHNKCKALSNNNNKYRTNFGNIFSKVKCMIRASYYSLFIKIVCFREIMGNHRAFI